MVMGPTHAMSGAAVWLTAAAASVPIISNQPTSAIIVGTAVCAGSALLPDIDGPGSISLKDGSTAVRAFGVLGEAIGHPTDTISLAIYNLTRGRRDQPKTNGHRTFTHTAVFAFGTGALVSAATTLPGTFHAFGRTWGTGNVITLAIMWAFLHLALFGLAEKWAKKQRAKYGLLAVMTISGAATIATATQLEHTNGGFGWLGLAVTTGIMTHLAGDALTKAGVPILWPIPINGKHWYDIAPPSAFRIKAGGPVEYALYLPLFTLAAIISGIYLMPGGDQLVATAAHLVGI